MVAAHEQCAIGALLVLNLGHQAPRRALEMPVAVT